MQKPVLYANTVRNVYVVKSTVQVMIYFLFQKRVYTIEGTNCTKTKITAPFPPPCVPRKLLQFIVHLIKVPYLRSSIHSALL